MHTGLKSLYDQSFIMQDMSTRMCALHTRTHAHRHCARVRSRMCDSTRRVSARAPPPGVPPVHARARAYKAVSFASEPIQLPIVPVKPFEPRELRSTRERTASAERGRAGPSSPRGIGGAGAQHDEVGERAERGRQRAAQLVPIGSAAQRRRLPPHRIGVCTRVRGWYVQRDAICTRKDQARHPQ